jgi:ubiquinone/menaquinone biosynthesis C-methylase UbiE
MIASGLGPEHDSRLMSSSERKLEEAHSSDQFGEQRDFWWNRDFLDLMARRWKLAEACSLADIGCGLCHWSRLLYPYLRKPARFAGVDREERWVNEGKAKSLQYFPDVASELLSFARGDATSIPLPDDSFDVATCQTVLMHLDEPQRALSEMIRVLRPGGLLICVEPNNLWNYMAFSSLAPEEPVDVVARRFEFWLCYHRGKKAEGQGDHCIGDLLPGFVAQAGLKDILVYQSDRAASLFPPYATAAQRAMVKQDQQWRQSGKGQWDAVEVRRQVLRGGGTPELFDRVFRELAQKFEAEQSAIKAGRFHAGYGGLLYLVSGRKPVK